jgi:hypothetical protein
LRGAPDEPLETRLRCPQCGGGLDGGLACGACGQAYPRLASVTVLLPQPAAHLAHWRAQLGLIAQQGGETARALEAQAEEAGTGAAARTRLRALARAVETQVQDVAAVLGPALGGPLPPREGGGLPRGIVEYVGYLYRDWGWSDGRHEENQRALAAVRGAVGRRALGRTLVLGAGACRLAYDLHRSCGARETSALDVDPYLLVMAEAVVRGASVPLTESAANVQELDAVSRRWTLRAPDGPLGDDAFRFFLADGLAPPFEDRTFDTVVTPWFIDQVPADLPAFLAAVHRLLAPAGRWIHHGPLVYRPDLPLARWFSLEEVIDLARAIGFHPERPQVQVGPYLVSPLTGRGKVEKVFTFVAPKAGPQ